MTTATDNLARARAELAAAEDTGSPEVDVAQAAVEQAEQEVEDEGGRCLGCGYPRGDWELGRACVFCGGLFVEER